MRITKISIKNFRALLDTELDVDEKLSLLIGKNNSGKTSFLILFDKFYNNKSTKINYDDFSISLRKNILEFNESTNECNLAIRLCMEIEYGEGDRLDNLSEFIIDLNSDKMVVKLAFECLIDKKALLEKLNLYDDIGEKSNFIIKNLSGLLKYNVYVFNQQSDFNNDQRYKLIEKDMVFVRKLINFQLIHAKRNVASSEEVSDSKHILSHLTTKYFNSKNELANKDIANLNKQIRELDNKLSINYEAFFKPFLLNAKTFLDLDNMKVESNLESNELLTHSSKVTYGNNQNESLPEYLNGLGFMNILYLLLTIEIKKEDFNKKGNDINILCIEEPEAHTHPQMQYVFAREIEKILEDVPHLQTLITTHSAYILSQSDFKHIKYFKEEKSEEGEFNIIIKNFYNEMLNEYEKKGEKELFEFLQKYLSIQSSELFFATKVIFIEGISEQILIRLFMKYHDDAILKIIENEKERAKKDGKEESQDILNRENELLLSQNITIMEVGANAKAFKNFLNLFGVKTLILTDLDSVDSDRKKVKVSDGVNTSNETIKYFYKYDEKDKEVYNKLTTQDLEAICEQINVRYQKETNDYQSRSFEDDFIINNIDTIIDYKEKILGLKCKDKLNNAKDEIAHNFQYELIYGKPEGTNGNLIGGIFDCDKKADFAASIYYLALTEEDNSGVAKIRWEVPSYIKEGLEWLAK